ncbi:MAG: ATPase [Paracoccaceae bacterium]
MHAPLLYPDPDAYLAAPQKRVALFGMSGLGKTRAAAMLRKRGDWFHYSVDYRIGTRYMGEAIVDNVKREAMKVPFLRDLLRSDSVYIASNIAFENLAPLSTYLGKPGDPARGGLPFAEYLRRQREHHAAEVAALLDTAVFIEKAQAIYGYAHFLCDTGGSLCEVVRPDDPADPVLSELARAVLLVHIRETEAHAEGLVARFAEAPKPMCYPETFLTECWEAYLAETGAAPERVDPDAFAVWGFRRLIAHRSPRYAAIARHWGVTVELAEIEAVASPAEFDALIARAIARAAGSVGEMGL